MQVSYSLYTEKRRREGFIGQHFWARGYFVMKFSGTGLDLWRVLLIATQVRYLLSSLLLGASSYLLPACRGGASA